MENDSQQELFKTIFNSFSVAVILVDQNGEVLLANRSTSDLLGYGREHLIGQSIELFLPESLQAKHKYLMEEYFESPSVRKMGAGRDLYAIDRQGNSIPVEIGLTPLRYKDRLAVLTTITDIRERLRHAADQEALFKTLFDTTPVAKLLVDRHGKITLANKQAFELFGYTEESLIGECVNVLLPSDLQDRHMQYMKGYFHSPVVHKTGRELFAINQAGNKIPVEIALAPLRFRDNDSVLATISDISERKKLEAQIQMYIKNLEVANKELTASNKSLDEFVYVASHDLKAPLRNIQNLATWIEEDDAANLSASSKVNLGLLKQRSIRLQNLLESLLEYSRIGRQDVQFSELDCNRLVEDLIASLPIPDYMRVRRTSTLPSLYTSEIQFNMVMGNLISNAIKHHDKTTDAWVQISATEDSGTVYFSVKDNGPGIAPEYHQKIYAIFQTLKRRDEEENSGVGLAIVKKTLDTLGGNIVLDPEHVKGANFIVHWPKQGRTNHAN